MVENQWETMRFGLFPKDTRNCLEKAMKISHFNTSQSASSIYIMIELCYFSLDQWDIRIHLLWGKCFNIPHHWDPPLNQTKFNDLLPLTIHGVLAVRKWFVWYLISWSPIENFDLRRIGKFVPGDRGVVFSTKSHFWYLWPRWHYQPTAWGHHHHHHHH